MKNTAASDKVVSLLHAAFSEPRLAGAGAGLGLERGVCARAAGASGGRARAAGASGGRARAAGFARERRCGRVEARAVWAGSVLHVGARSCWRKSWRLWRGDAGDGGDGDDGGDAGGEHFAGG